MYYTLSHKHASLYGNTSLTNINSSCLVIRSRGTKETKMMLLEVTRKRRRASSRARDRTGVLSAVTGGEIKVI